MAQAVSPDSRLGVLSNQERRQPQAAGRGVGGVGVLTWETGHTWVSAKPLLALPSANSALATVIGGFVGPLGYRNDESLPSSLSFSIWQTPEMLVEIEKAWSLSGYLLVCFSAGRSCRKALNGWGDRDKLLIRYPLQPHPHPSARVFHPRHGGYRD